LSVGLVDWDQMTVLLPRPADVGLARPVAVHTWRSVGTWGAVMSSVTERYVDSLNRPARLCSLSQRESTMPLKTTAEDSYGLTMRGPSGGCW
jgi:hypothetical protein